MKNFLRILFLIVCFGPAANAQISESDMLSSLRQTLVQQHFPDGNKVEILIYDQYTTAHNQVKHVYGFQTINGQEIFNAPVDMHFDAKGKIITMHHRFVDLSQVKTLQKGIKIDAIQAIEKVLQKEGIVFNVKQLNKNATIENGKQVFNNPALSSERIFVKTGWWMQDQKLVSVQQVELLNDETGDWFNTKVDANSGEILDQYNYTLRCSPQEMGHFYPGKFASFEKELEAPIQNSLKKKSNLGTYAAFPLPLESPIHGSRQLLTDVHTIQASPYGWHDTNGVAGPEFTITRGNNVFAKEDTLANNGIGYSPNGGDSLLFNFPYDINAKPRENLNAAITNLFFMNNTLHDVLFSYGFDEESGNFQAKNYSGKGRQGDAVNADAQDGSGTSNANFSTPADGSSGRMQMFLWPTDAAATNNTLGILYPLSIDGNYFGLQSVAGPRLNAAGLPGQVVLVKDSGASTNFGCGTIENAAELNGKIAFIERGGPCGTQNSVARNKIKRLQALGAIGVIIAHNLNTSSPSAVSGLDNTITIPSITIGFGNGVMLKTALGTDSVFAVLFDSSAFNPARIYDSDFDNGIIAHELGHGVSNRLTGGPQNTSCLGNQEQAGEGWSDFFALAFTTRPWENGNNAARGIGTYVQDEDTTGLGIRPFRYSRNMVTNPVNYNSIRTLSIPHGVGFVFCSMLYDIFWDMVDVYGYDEDLYEGKGGNNKTIQLVIDGLKLQPCQPGFIDARDAILLADSINNNGANKELLWKAFARRSLGYGAKQGSTNSRSDGTQAFDLPPVTGLPSGVNNYQFDMYPNPASESLTINVFNGAQLQKTEIYDISGKLVQTEKHLKGAFNSSTFNLQLPTGYYIVKIYTNEGVAAKKLIVE